MLLTITGYHIGADCTYVATSIDGTFYKCCIQQFTPKTTFDKVPAEINLYKVRGRWKSDLKIYRQLTQTLGASIDEQLLEIKK